jgi:hypothetical protein
MVKPEFPGHGKRLSTAQSLGGGQENLFFHSDMPQKPGPELSVRGFINLIGINHGRLK